MNTINEQTATLTKLIAEIVDFHSPDDRGLAVELDYLIKHLQKYHQTCEECLLCQHYYTIWSDEPGVCLNCRENYRCQLGEPNCQCAACTSTEIARFPLEESCPHCKRNEEECEKNKKGVTNPITEWCGWGLSCDDCYYKNHPESDDEESEDGEVCNDCGCDLTDKHYTEVYGNMVCDECVEEDDESVASEDDESVTPNCHECGKSTVGRKIRGLWDNVLCEDCGDDEESEDGDWDGDLEDTPNCHECGEDCGRTIVTHQKYKNTYFCSQKCQRIYDGDQDNFTHRQCEYRECDNGFDLADPHYYDEEQSVCYCCEECYKNECEAIENAV